MTLNLLFFTIIIKKQELTTEEVLHEQRINKIMEENKERQILLGGFSRHL
ncbi:MAG: YrzI family small protein [Bacillus sp. (in: firmicutes)]